MGAVMEEEKIPTYVHCSECQYQWVWWWGEINVRHLQDVTIKRCPYCHGKKIYMGKAPNAPKEVEG
jgi:DNA-directed RNA polymerase subunit RPC12/RpoP